MTLKKILITVGVVVIVLLVAGAGFLLYRGYSEFSKANTSLGKSKRALEGLYNREPFPSDENLKREQDNVRILGEWLTRLLDDLRRGQVEPRQITPSNFMALFNRTQNELVSLADSRGAKLPAALGFDKYSLSGELPAPSDVPRLTQQLTVVEMLSRVVLESGVSEIVSVEREVFEDGVVAPRANDGESGRRGRSRSRTVAPSRDPETPKESGVGVLNPGDLYAKLHFRLSLKAKEAALLDVLNRLSAHEMFVTVTSVTLEKIADDILPSDAQKGLALDRSADAAIGGGSAADEAQGAVPAEIRHLERDVRIVSGPKVDQPMRVVLELDVYRFAESI